VTESNQANDFFDALARILLRCFVMGYLLVLLWFVFSIVLSEALYGWLGGKLYGLTQHEVDLINYCGLAAMKLIVILFFLLPYAAIRLVPRKRA
jgi:hypothetical protein